ncbi:MAG: glycosyltransferase, partial [Blastocatellia bacterium]
EGVERSVARNKGAAAARGEKLVFVDDDMTVAHDFLSSHLKAQYEWPGALVVGGVRFSDNVLATPFGSFRKRLEQRGTPGIRGLTSRHNFCTAANLSVSRDSFRSLGGFDDLLRSGEDQDLALRHTSRGGQIAFIPEAEAIHNDSALDLRSYCRRAEWGAEHMVPFCKRYPEWPDNVERDRVNGPIQWDRVPISHNLRKLLKQAITLKPAIAVGFAIAEILERIAPASAVLDRIYRLLLGAHILRGYRKGLRRYWAESGKTVNQRVVPAVVRDEL